MTESTLTGGVEPIEVNPVVVLVQVFPARPSSIPDIREFVRRCLAESPLTEEGNREVGETVFRALLDAAGPEGSIQVAFRIFPEHVEVDVLHSDNQVQPGVDGAARTEPNGARRHGAQDAAPGAEDATDGRIPVDDGRAAGRDTTLAASASGREPTGNSAAADHGPSSDRTGHPTTFAEWMSVALRREGLTQEAAARLLGVSVKTVSRWVGGTTEPRLRDLRRIREVFGEVPLH